MQTQNDYRHVVSRFASIGSEIIRLDPKTHYERLGHDARRPLEPGFIPVAQRALLTAISFYPNESDLPSEEYASARASFAQWGSTGTYDDYAKAYDTWQAFRQQIPFYHRWEAPLYDRLGLKPAETAWLPLVKCPLPARTRIDRNGIDITRDMHLLWDQLTLLKPEIILIQGAVVSDVLGKRLDNLKFIRAHPVQKIPQQISSLKMGEQMDELVRVLGPQIEALRAERADPGLM